MSALRFYGPLAELPAVDRRLLMERGLSREPALSSRVATLIAEVRAEGDAAHQFDENVRDRFATGLKAVSNGGQDKNCLRDAAPPVALDWPSGCAGMLEGACARP